MGTLVPLPPGSASYIWTYTETRSQPPPEQILVQPVHLWAWLCLHCHTVQPADKVACCNCGAPKPQQEAQP